MSASVRSENTIYAGTRPFAAISRRFVAKCREELLFRCAERRRRPLRDDCGRLSRASEVPLLASHADAFALRSTAPSRASFSARAIPRQLSHPSQCERAAGSPKYRSTNPRLQSFRVRVSLHRIEFRSSALRRRSIKAQSIGSSRVARPGVQAEVRRRAAPRRRTVATEARRAMLWRQNVPRDPAEVSRDRSSRLSSQADHRQLATALAAARARRSLRRLSLGGFVPASRAVEPRRATADARTPTIAPACERMRSALSASRGLILPPIERQRDPRIDREASPAWLRCARECGIDLFDERALRDKRP